MFDTFIKIDGIEGESQDDKHTNWIEVASFAHSMAQPPSATVSSLGGGTTGRVQFEEFSFVKGLDKASPKLYEACCKGTHIGNAVVEMCRAGGDKLIYMKIEMADVVVTKVSPAGNPKGDGEFPTDTVSLNAAKITWTYTQQDRKSGQAKGQVQTMWNLAKGSAS